MYANASHRQSLYKELRFVEEIGTHRLVDLGYSAGTIEARLNILL
jgi:hypothetical protein